MIRRLVTLPYRAWLRHDLKWIEDRIADEEERHARHAQMIRGLEADAAEIRWKLKQAPPNRNVLALWPRDQAGERQA